MRGSKGVAVLGLGSGFLAAVGTGEGVVSTEMLGTDTGVGVGALTLLVGAGVEGASTKEGDAPALIAPVSRLTRFAGTDLPPKNSLADSAGSADGARGYMSDWKESDWGCMSVESGEDAGDGPCAEQ